MKAPAKTQKAWRCTTHQPLCGEKPVDKNLATGRLSTDWGQIGKLPPMRWRHPRGFCTALGPVQVSDGQAQSTLIHRNGGPLSTIYQWNRRKI